MEGRYEWVGDWVGLGLIVSCLGEVKGDVDDFDMTDDGIAWSWLIYPYSWFLFTS